MKKYSLVISLVIIVILAATLIVLAYIMKSTSCESAGTMKVLTTYMKLAPAVAKASLDNDKEIILLDVRTIDEYNEKHIPGSILIPDYELEERAKNELPNKDAVIFIYCRTGNRSKSSALLLIELGYNQVYDIGGIADWPYEVES